MRRSGDYANGPTALGRRRRWSTLVIGLFVLLTPLAILRPELEAPGEAALRRAASFVLRPLDSLRAWPALAAAKGPRADPRDVRLRARLQAALDRRALRAWDAGQLQLAGVLRVEGSRRRERLVLDTELSFDDGADFAGAPVVHGEDLIGFVADVRTGADANEGFDGRLRVRLIDNVPTRRETRLGITRRRLVGIATSMRDPEAPALRLLVEAAHPKDPFRLRVVRSAPRQLETWAESVAPYLARTTSSARLHPELPDGLILGHVEDLGYRERAFVLERFVEPRFDVRSLVRVGVVGGRERPRLRAPAPSVRRPARRVWSSPIALSWRRALIASPGLESGAALVDGQRLLGRVAWASAGQGAVRPLCDPSWTTPLLLLGEDGAARAIVARGAGLARSQDAQARVLGRFKIEHPTRGLEARDSRYEGAWVFTGVHGAQFPHGLLCGRVRVHAGKLLLIDLFGLAPWPETFETTAGRGSREQAR